MRRAMSAAKIAPPAGPDSTRRTGNSAAVSTEIMPAAGMDHEDRAADAHLARADLQPVEIGLAIAA